MKIDVICSSDDHPVIPWLKQWMRKHETRHRLGLLRKKTELTSGDILFLISCTELISSEQRKLYRHCIVLHASDLPAGRGWSPHIWSILEGASTITVSAIDAEDRVDSGAIWAQRAFDVAPHQLHDEIDAALFDAEIALLDQVVGMVERGETPGPQPNTEASYYPRRTPADSEVDPGKSISEQFDKIRVCDPNRYPAFFRLHGHVYSISLKKVQSDDKH